MKPLVIYHDNCADGFGAAFAAWLKLGDEAEYLPMQYGFHVDDLDNIPYQNNTVYMLDFSWPKPIMENLFERAKRVVWLDHHKTAFEMYDLIPNKYDETPVGVFGVLECLISRHYVCLDNNKSGAMLAWKYFHSDKEIPMLIKHIDDYDRWQFKLDGTKEFNKALWSYAPWSFEQWQNVLGLEPLLYTEGKAILRAHDANVQMVVKNSARKCSIVPTLIDSTESYKAPWTWWVDPEFGDTCGVNGLAANCPPHLASDVGHELAKQSGTFGLLWYINKEGKCLCSLRSNGNYDVSAIAKTFGGGGHKNAAGFEVDVQTLLGWIK